jgi:hydroxypyruvate isomerase
VLSIPSRSGEFHDNIDVAVGIGRELGVGAFNALYGNRVEGVDPAEQDEVGRAGLAAAAKAADAIGATVLVEPVSGPKPYPLRTAADAVSVIDAVRGEGATNVGMLADLFHLANNGDDVEAAIAAYADRIAHVQIADLPGRGEPGSGDLDLDTYLDQLESAGYTGWIALEYNPTTTTVESLEWLPRELRGASA